MGFHAFYRRRGRWPEVVWHRYADGRGDSYARRFNMRQGVTWELLRELLQRMFRGLQESNMAFRHQALKRSLRFHCLLSYLLIDLQPYKMLL